MRTSSSYPLVLLLLLLQHQLDEQLLQFLVAVVDAELLETVLPKNFEAVDVKNSNYRGIGDVRLKIEDIYKDERPNLRQTFLTSVVEGSMAALT